MSSATPATRVAGWNVKFTIGPEKNPRAFAGIYQAVGSYLVTFRDVCNELRLCFEFPNDTDSDDPWASITFALAHRPDLDARVRCLSFVNGDLLDHPIQSLPPTHPRQQNVIKYHLVSHKSCDLPSSEPLDSHLKKGCAQHLSNPTRRYDPRYLPPNEMSPDPTVSAKIPLWQMLKARAEGFRSGWSSPNSEENDNDMDITNDTAGTFADSFRAACLTKATCCAVSRQGESWCPGLPISPGIQACHIVPEIHYHLYPGSRNDGDTTIEACLRRLQEAWENTWSPDNGILLRKDLHVLFDARLFSIHPETFRIRVFVPCDILIEFNDKIALIHPDTDRRALQHHYEMCCIENMSAARPNLCHTS
ncbi:hypothetical protein F5Y10DRAFT_259000 [Nemania abortiva]|nr:hypothetical protein F5Y10DRAFT_259000 [Nemania abortiva]